MLNTHIIDLNSVSFFLSMSLVFMSYTQKIIYFFCRDFPLLATTPESASKQLQVHFKAVNYFLIFLVVSLTFSTISKQFAQENEVRGQSCNIVHSLTVISHISLVFPPFWDEHSYLFGTLYYPENVNFNYKYIEGLKRL